MQELFRFYTIRAADPVPGEEFVALETLSPYQASLSGPNVTAASAVSASRALVDQSSRVVLHDLDTLGNPIRAFKPGSTASPLRRRASRLARTYGIRL